jgi:hypothetical protein
MQEDRITGLHTYITQEEKEIMVDVGVNGKTNSENSETWNGIGSYRYSVERCRLDASGSG